MKTWQDCVAFHGHECGGLTIGYKASLYAIELLNLEFSADEQVVCIAENDACGIDGIQVMLGCSIGKGNLLFHMRGKSAYSFYNRKTGASVRLVLKPGPVGMTREEDCRVKLGDRAAFANKRNAKVFISIHCNASENHKGNGIETFYTEQKGLEDKILAEMIQNAVMEQTDAFDRGIKTADYTVIVRTTMPAALIEVGFLTDEAEKEMLQDKEYQEKLAKGISEGIIRYLKSLKS